jgi:hypothetical protein
MILIIGGSGVIKNAKRDLTLYRRGYYYNNNSNDNNNKHAPI